MRPIFYLFFSILSSCVLTQQRTETAPITKKSNPSGGGVFMVVDEEPKFPEGEIGLLRFYQQHSEHPIAGKNDSAAVVYYQVIINEEGEVTQFKILKSQSKNLNEITKKLVNKMPKWKPGKHSGKPVKVVKNLSVRYAVFD